MYFLQPTKSKILFQSKVMRKTLLKITEIARLPKSVYQTYLSQIFIAQIGDMYEDCVKMSRPYLSYFPKNKPWNSVTIGPGRFIVLNDSASPKMVIQIYLNFSDFI